MTHDDPLLGNKTFILSFFKGVLSMTTEPPRFVSSLLRFSADALSVFFRLELEAGGANMCI